LQKKEDIRAVTKQKKKTKERGRVAEVYAMLSVNSYMGQVWYHTWHGTFVQEIELS